MRGRVRLPSLFGVLPLLILLACQGGVPPADAEATGGAAEDDAAVFEFVALNYAFQGPAEIPSGWVTFRMPNPSDEHHVIVLYRLPDGVSYADWHRASERRGRTGEVPDWWGEQIAMGGPGALAPGLVGETTMRLDPGEYVMLCGVPAPDGTLHSDLGMVRGLTVTEEDSGASEPTAELTLTLRSHEFQLDGSITPGRHTVRVLFEDQPASPRWHDVHVARLEADQTARDVADLMKGNPVEGISAFTFIGGAEQMPAGHTAYFTAEFEPGRYAWACHYHADKDMVQEFTVR